MALVNLTQTDNWSVDGNDVITIAVSINYVAAVLLTAGAFTAGMIYFIAHVEGHGVPKMLTIFSAAMLAAFGMGFY